MRGGGAASTLGALDDEAVARAIATSAVPVIAGLGHASDLTLADRVAWRSCDTPSKALALVREILVVPARRARTDHAAILAGVAAGTDRARPELLALERRVAAAVLRHTVSASERLDRSWGAVRTAAEAARERLARMDDGLVRIAADTRVARAVLLGRTESELAALMEAVRARARRAGTGADDGGALVAAVTVRTGALVATAEAELEALGRGLPVSVAARVDGGAAAIEALAATVRTRARERLGRAGDGSRQLAVAATAAAAGHRAQEAAIERLRQLVETAVLRRLDAAASALERATVVLDAADPAHVLARGYVLVTDAAGRPVTSVATAKPAAILHLAFADGALTVRRVDPQPTTFGDL